LVYNLGDVIGLFIGDKPLVVKTLQNLLGHVGNVLALKLHRTGSPLLDARDTLVYIPEVAGVKGGVL
jgi:CTP:molybdopterin cytidylyltransferase MocA